MAEKQPVYILPENVQRMLGRDAQRNNILAARLVAETVKTTLGPFQIEGFNKIGPAKFAWDTIDLTDSGIFGPAGHSMVTTTATAAAGREMMEPYIKEICNFVNKLKKADINDLITKPYSS